MAFEIEGFSGIVRLFPLPNLVMFPHVMQPLHLFEPRYMAMLESAVRSDRLIAMGLLKPGWENYYEGRPTPHPMACLGRVAAHNKTEDNRFNILVMGLRRIRLIEELNPTKPYREFLAELCEDNYPLPEKDLACLHNNLLLQFKSLLPQLPMDVEQFEQVASHADSLGMLTDVISYTLNLEVEVKEELLTELNVIRRAEKLLRQMELIRREMDIKERSPFPPEFSLN